jgi:hypothetical protein
MANSGSFSPTATRRQRKMKEITIDLGANGAIILSIEGKGGQVVSSLARAICPSCANSDCCFSCDGSQGADDNNEETEEDVANRLTYNGVMDAIESLVLAHACAGINVTSPKYIEGIITTIDAAGNELS